MFKNLKKPIQITQVLLLIIIPSILLIILTSIAAAADPQLEILGGPITLSPDNEKSATMKSFVTIRNNSKDTAVLAFRAISDKGDNIEINPVVQDYRLPGFSVRQYELEFPKLVDEAVMGKLIVEAPGIGPAVEALTIKPLLRFRDIAMFGIIKMNMDMIIVISFFAGFILLLVLSLIKIFRGFRKKKVKTSQVLELRMSGLKWNFSENWASTFVAVGGLLTTLVGSVILPENPVSISKAGFQALNLLFPILITLAPFLLSALNALGKEPRKSDGTLIVDSDGKTPLLILPFVIGSSVVTWAVIGELLTLSILFQELRIAMTLTSVITMVAQIFILLLCLLGFYYAWEKTTQISLTAESIVELLKENQTEIRQAARPVESSKRSVYLP